MVLNSLDMGLKVRKGEGGEGGLKKLLFCF